ncbi:hypothetical protein [Jongsikchunia kroppenstedtii]|uniref:hypothetical protein n=1 Tax=Jongsikchunia kroppenstedtii TaxID=1121721 RepID=UPI00035F0FD3|nr:hypothetical protein [Jongsikchunia kroppenstedtii]
MKSIITKSVVATAAVATALTFGTAVAGAAPATPTQPTKPSHPPITVQVAPGVQYTGDAKTGTTELATPFGIVRTAPGQVAVVDNSGKTLFGNPALKRPTGTPAAPSAKNNAALAGSTNAADAPKSQADKNADIQSSINNVATNFGLATGVGAMVGGVGGAILGCVFPGALAGVDTAGTMAIPACIIGGGTVGGLGAIVGGAVVGVPVGIASGIYEYQQLQANGDL